MSRIIVLDDIEKSQSIDWLQYHEKQLQHHKDKLKN